MTGLLWSHVSTLGATDCPPWADELAIADLSQQLQTARLWVLLERSVGRFAELGVDVATIKGVTVEARWYARRGERPCADVDLVVSPQAAHRVPELVTALEPHHPLLPMLEGLLSTAQIQSVDMRGDPHGRVDLHLDMLKIGVPSRSPEALWARTETFALPGGGHVRVLDREAQAFQLLVHLNKARFPHLLGYGDLARIAGHGVDWDVVASLAAAEGLDVPVRHSLASVWRLLDLEGPLPLPLNRASITAAVWSVVWRPSTRLQGDRETLAGRRFSGLWFAVIVPGRRIEGIRWLLREVLPPPQLVRLQHPELRGRYLRRLVAGRIAAARSRRAERRELAKQGGRIARSHYEH